MSRALAWAALALLATPSAAVAQDPAPSAAQRLGEPLPQRAPAKVYASTCGYCHGRNVGPVILGRHLPAEAVRLMVRGGRNAMPAFRPSEITEAELTALARWVQLAPAQTGEKGQ